jgi:hypothetical protein
LLTHTSGIYDYYDEEIEQDYDAALEAFINAVQAQRGNKLTDAQADELVENTQAVIDSLS